MKYTTISLFSLLLRTTLAVPQISPRDVDPENPSASDPKTPPTSLKAPPRPIDNPFAGKSRTVPSTCGNLWNPSAQCIRDLQAQNDDVDAYSGDLKFEDKSCTEPERLSLEIAAWDALTLANFGAKAPQTAKEIATWRAYIGPDFSKFQDRMIDNLNRVKDHRTKKKFDIIASCKDEKNLCHVKIDGKAVGGYAWTQDGFFGYEFYHISLCPIYFSLDTLDEEFEMIQDGLARGETKYAKEADWQKNQGQYFLHEMTHLRSIGKPKVVDEKVDGTGVGSAAYGPRLVHMLAQRPLNQGGGASRSSTNADSYAWLVNSLYFYDATGYFPRPPKFKNGAENSTSLPTADDVFPVNLGSFQGKVDDKKAKDRFRAEVDSMRKNTGGAPQSGNNEPPPGTKCGEDVSEKECAGKYDCPNGKDPGCVKMSLLDILWCTCV